MEKKVKFLTQVFGRSKQYDVELTVPCPKCNDASKLKMSIRLDKDVYHCWICNLKGGNLGRLIKMKRPDLVSQYYDKFGGRFPYNNLSFPITADPVVLPLGFRLVMANLGDPAAKAVRNYAHSRGLTDRDLWKNRIGYTSDDWKFQRRLIIPSFDSEGELNYFVTRSIDDNPYKYLNAKADKQSIVFNEIDIDWQADSILLVEGPFDLMKCGDINASCLLGSSIQESSILFSSIVRNAMDVVLSLDPDAWKKQLLIADSFLSYDINIFLASHTDAERDLGDMNKKEVEHLYNNRIKYEGGLSEINYLIEKL